VKYPELIEAGLRLTGRQVTVEGRRLDLMFEDHLMRRLLIELKWGPIKDAHVGQIMAYAGSLRSHDDPDLRVMLIGTRVPPNLQRSLDFHGIAWKEITVRTILAFLLEKHDYEFVHLFTNEAVMPTAAETKRLPEAASLARNSDRASPPLTASLQDVAVRTVIATQGSLNNTYIKVRGFLDWFEPDTIGGRNKTTRVGREMLVEWEGQTGLATDIDDHHKTLRNRTLVSRFMRDSGLKVGDRVQFRRLGPYHYRLSRLEPE